MIHTIINALACRTLAQLALTQELLNTTQQKATVTMIEGGAQRTHEIIVQEDGCGQRVKQDRVVLLIDSILEKLTHEEM